MGKGGIIGKLQKALRNDDSDVEEEEDWTKVKIRSSDVEEYFGDYFESMAESLIEGQISKDLFSGDKNDAIAEKKKVYIEDFAKEFQKKMRQLQHGIDLCIELLPAVCSGEERERIANEMVKGCDQWIDDYAAPQKEMKLESGMSLQKSLGYSNETLRTFYQCGKRLYGEDRMEDARDVFEMILMLNVGFKDAWTACGMAEQKLKNHQTAVEYYMIASNLDSQNPTILYWLTTAFLAMENVEGAEWSFGKFQEVVKEIGKKAEWKDRRNGLKRLIQQKKKKS